MTSSYSPQSSPGPAPARGPVAGGRVGLSEYTAQRLAELRARRAADAESEIIGPSTVQPATKSTPTPRTAHSSAIAPPSQPPPPPPPAPASSSSEYSPRAESSLSRVSPHDRRADSPSSTGEPADGGPRAPGSSYSRRAMVAPSPTRSQSEVRATSDVSNGSSPLAAIRPQYPVEAPTATLPSANGTSTNGHSSVFNNRPSTSANSSTNAHHQHSQSMSSSCYVGNGANGSGSPSMSKRMMSGSRPVNDVCGHNDCVGFSA
jgi:hypothetical protein